MCLASNAPIVEVTGGEPLLQPGFSGLVAALKHGTTKTVLVETNGSLDISLVPEGIIAVMDLKCPGSGESEAMDLANIGRLRPYDEVKFVLSDRSDYEWARNVVVDHDLASVCRGVFFMPARGRLEPREIGAWLLEDGTPARLQLQLHKVLELQ
jgi:7-carboxy-7-deazaguanine synthase